MNTFKRGFRSGQSVFKGSALLHVPSGIRRLAFVWYRAERFFVIRAFQTSSRNSFTRKGLVATAPICF